MPSDAIIVMPQKTVRTMARPAASDLRRAFTVTVACSIVAMMAGCTNLSLPGVGTDYSSVPASAATTAPPEPDARGVISFPTYQAVRARSGDTVTTVAERLDIDAAALSLRNGLPEDAVLRDGELLLLPTRVAETTDGDDLAALANSALDRADETAAASPAATTTTTSDGAEPVRHKVARGETAYSIARLYNVSVRSLADWNGLPSDYAVREGQTLLIPQTRDGGGATATPATTTEPPGTGSAAPQPPSSSAPLPEKDLPSSATAAPVTVTPLAAPQTSASDTTRLAKPVEGRILRGYDKGKNDGVDFGASAGASVRAAEAGTVAAITRDVDQVPIIVVRHANNLLTVYANVDAISVAKGDQVSRGQQMAVVRQSDPSFLHFEVRDGFDSVDPLEYLGK